MAVYVALPAGGKSRAAQLKGGLEAYERRATEAMQRRYGQTEVIFLYGYTSPEEIDRLGGV